VLLFDAAEARMGVPLESVWRLEELAPRAIERTAGGLVVQYNDDLLRLLPVEGPGFFVPRDPQPVIVLSDGRRMAGLMVDKVFDIVEEPLVLRNRSRRPGLAGTAVVQARAVDIVDVAYYLSRGDDDCAGQAADDAARCLEASR
jgi:two-component system chemotaxis sensor kinase CheA